MMPSTLRPKRQQQQMGQQQPIEIQQIDIETANSQLPSTLKPKSKKPKQEGPFPFEGENDLEREIERNTAQGTSRMLETIGGAPGDIYSFVKSMFGYSPETSLPTSKSLRDFSEKATRGYTTPQNEYEERGGELLQDVASFMLPGSGQYSLMRNIGIPIAANLAKEGVKLTGSEKLGDPAKIGVMVALDLMAHRKGGAKKFATDLFKESEALIPKNEYFHSTKLQKAVDNLDKTLNSGGSAPSTEKALKKVSELKQRMSWGDIEVKELVDFRKNINEIISDMGGFEVQMAPHIKKKAIANLQNVKKEVIGALEEYGQKVNPKFGKLNASANEAYAAYESSNKVASFINKTVKNSIKNPSLKLLFGLGGGYGLMSHAAGAAKTAAVGALPMYASYEAYKVLHQVVQSPTLRKYYGNVLKGAAAGNASQVSRNMMALEKGMDKEDRE